MSTRTPGADVKRVRRYPEDGTPLTTGEVLRAAAPVVSFDNYHMYTTESGLAVIASMDRSIHGALLHVSLSRADRLPSWEEVKAIRAAFYPADIDVMMVLPAERDYVNVHDYCFHLWQTPKVWGLQ